MTSIVVVGGGPVGVTTSLLLAHRGFEVIVLERAPEVYDLPRAIVMDDEIQRVFQSIGLIDELRAITSPMPGAEFVGADGERIIGIELPIDTVWPYGHHPSVSYYQPELEAFLRSAAVDAGVDLRLGWSVDAVEDLGDHVMVAATDPNGVAHRFETAWAVAADGAASPVRKSLGISFVSLGFDQDWLVIDVRIRQGSARADALPGFTQQICDPARPTTFVVGHGDYRRWEFQLQPGDDRSTIATDGAVWELMAPWLTPGDAELVRAVVYRFHATVADSMRSGRILLAGDAAHQMPPFLGQGLCAGIRDAANMAWKLQLVDLGVASEALLDSYGQERLPHATGVVAHAVDTGKLIDQLSGRAPESLGLDSAYGGTRPFPHFEYGVVTGEHPLVGRPLPQPMVAGRPLDELLGDGFAIVVDEAGPPTDAAAVWARLGARVVPVPAPVFGDLLPPKGTIVVRPDRYVAGVAATADEFDAMTQQLIALIQATPV